MVRFDSSGGTYILEFDGSAAGVPAGLDLDAAHLLPTGNLLLSFDAGGSFGGSTFGDEDVLEHQPGTLGFEVSYDGSAQHGSWPAADLDALAAEIDSAWIFGDGFEAASGTRWSAMVGGS